VKDLRPSSPFASAGAIKQEIRQRYAELALVPSFAELLCHAAAKQRNGDMPSALATSLIPPGFFERHVDRTLAKRTRVKAAANRLAAMVAELEHAAVYCLLAEFPVAMPLNSVLDNAWMHCRRFDEIRASHEQAAQSRKLACRKGGHKRHNDFRRLQRLAIRFLRTKAPLDGWMSKVHAAESLCPHLSELAIKYRLSVSKCEQTIVDNVVKLTRTDPRAKEAFERHRSPRRSNRGRHRPR